METFFELLKQNPLLIIFLVWALISALGGVVAQKVKNAGERAKRSRQRTSLDPMDGALRAEENERDQERQGWQELERAGRQEREWQRQRAEQQSDEKPDAERIAAEIRRVMARERSEEEATAVPDWSAGQGPVPGSGPEGRRRPGWDSYVDEAETYAEEAYAEPEDFDEIETRPRAAARMPPSVTIVPDPPPRSSLRIKIAPPVERQTILALHRGSRYLDLSHPARLLVAMEVLGPPVALREAGQRLL